MAWGLTRHIHSQFSDHLHNATYYNFEGFIGHPLSVLLSILSWGKLNTVTLFCNAVLHRKEADSRKKANFVRSTSDTDKRVAMLLHHNQVNNIRNSQLNFTRNVQETGDLYIVVFALLYNVMTKCSRYIEESVISIPCHMFRDVKVP